MWTQYPESIPPYFKNAQKACFEDGKNPKYRSGETGEQSPRNTA